jgi:hypothetical protein
LLVKQRKVLIACKIFAREIEAVLSQDSELEILWIDAALHVDLPKLEQELQRVLADQQNGTTDIRILFGSGCHPDMCRLARRSGAGLAPVKNCIEAFCGEATKELAAKRTMVMTPGWIRAWPSIMQALGWDDVDTRINFGVYDRILLLEPGIHPVTEEEILGFFDLVQVPIEMEPLDLTHFTTILTQILQ